MPHPSAPMLLGIVIASALGAAVLCALLLRHGDVERDDATDRPLVFRLAHVIALGCFAVSVILGVAAASIAWRGQSRATETALDDTLTMRRELRQQREALIEPGRRLDERMTAAERHVGDTTPSSMAEPTRTTRGTERRAAPRRPTPTAANAPAASPGSPKSPVDAEKEALISVAPSPPVDGAAGTVANMPVRSSPAVIGTDTPARPPVAAADPDNAREGRDAADSPSCGFGADRLCARVTRWAAGEVGEFRDGVRRQVADVRDGVEHVKARMRKIRDAFAR